jgi:GNAT superfamily N-acetyltransferase
VITYVRIVDRSDTRWRPAAGPATLAAMEITPVALDDDEALREWYEVFSSAERTDHPGVVVIPFPELLEQARGSDTEREDFWLARSDGVAVGCYRLRMPQRDNLDAATLVLDVEPRHRRRGHGRALAGHAVDQVRAMGRSRVWVEVVEPVDGDPSAGAVLARQLGFRRALVQTRRVLDLTALDEARLTGLADGASARAVGYDLVAWTGPCPEEHLGGYAALVGRMSTDAPLDDLDLEPEAWDGDRIRSQEAVTAAQQRTVVVTAARHVASGELVAYTDIAVSEHAPSDAFQWSTIVRREDRGHRLGLLIKVANLRRVREQLPAAERVHTWNADSNDHMVAINEALGFEPLYREVEWQLDLPG